jgi:phosphoribosylglycinamide formyltransferase-1
MTNKKHRLAIFASGSGTNAAAIIDYFKSHPSIEVGLVLCNKPGAGVIERAFQRDVRTVVFSKEDVASRELLDVLDSHEIDFIALAGYLWLIPPYLVEAFPKRIINIHPALLPNYGGKGMYGMNVHKAVIANNEPESGITIHFVNEAYDEGAIILQATCTLTPEDTPEALAAKIHTLEYEHFAPTLEQEILAL